MFVLVNPGRVIPSQVRYMSLLPDQRYTPVSKRSDPIGIVLLVDNEPGVEEEVAKGESLTLH
jgi:hypothetical protein